jgi:hypothetical protein
MPKFEVLLRKSESTTHEKRVEVTAEDQEAAMELAVEGHGQEPDGWEETTDERGDGTQIEALEVEEVED